MWRIEVRYREGGNWSTSAFRPNRGTREELLQAMLEDGQFFENHKTLGYEYRVVEVEP